MLVICYIISTAASLVTCNRKKKMQQLLIFVLAFGTVALKWEEGFYRVFKVSGVLLRSKDDLQVVMSGPDPEKHLSVCLTLSI